MAEAIFTSSGPVELYSVRVLWGGGVTLWPSDTACFVRSYGWLAQVDAREIGVVVDKVAHAVLLPLACMSLVRRCAGRARVQSGVVRALYANKQRVRATHKQQTQTGRGPHAQRAGGRAREGREGPPARHRDAQGRG